MSEETTKKSLQAKVWDTLSSVNVNGQTKKKGGFTYLSWAWAWGVLMEYFPQSQYELHEPKIMTDGSVLVSVTLTIKEAEEQFTRYMWLPVLNYSNHAVKNPDANAMNKAYMRCLVKAIAMCGLGHYIYAGDDLPQEDEPQQQQQQQQQRQQQKRKPTGAEIVTEFVKKVGQCENLQALKELYGKGMPYIETHCNEEQVFTAQSEYELKQSEFNI